MTVPNKTDAAQSLVRQLVAGTQYENASEHEARIAEAKRYLHAVNVFFHGGKYEAARENAERFARLVRGMGHG